MLATLSVIQKFWKVICFQNIFIKVNLFQRYVNWVPLLLPPPEGLGFASARRTRLKFWQEQFLHHVIKMRHSAEILYWCKLLQTPSQISQYTAWKRVIGKLCGLHISITIIPYRSVCSRNERIWYKIQIRAVHAADFFRRWLLFS